MHAALSKPTNLVVTNLHPTELHIMWKVSIFTASHRSNEIYKLI